MIITKKSKTKLVKLNNYDCLFNKNANINTGYLLEQQQQQNLQINKSRFKPRK